MTKLLMTLVLCLFVVSPVFGFDFSGEWSGTLDKNNMICINKEGDEYKLNYFDIILDYERYNTRTGQPDRPISIFFDKKSDPNPVLKKVNDDEIELFWKGRKKFTIKQNTKSIKVIPDTSPNNLVRIVEFSKEYEDTIESYSQNISNIKWKRTKKTCN